MKKGLYLSEVLTPSSFQRGTFNLVVALCGSGKTTAAINTIAALASSPHTALFLIDTQNGNLRLAQNEALTRPYVFFENYAGAFHLPFGDDERPNKTVVSTYAQFGVWVSCNPDFASLFEVIICDEAHNIVLFPTYSPEPNYASIAQDAICEVTSGSRTLVVGITATPEPLERLKCPQYLVPIDQSSLRQYENKEVRPYSSLPQLLSQIPEGQRGMLYVKHIKMMKKCEEQAKAAGRIPICIWSAANKEHPMTDEQYEARAYILEHEEVPPQYDLFIFNASSMA